MVKIGFDDYGLFKVSTDKGVFYCHNWLDYDNLVAFDYYKVLSIEKIY